MTPDSLPLPPAKRDQLQAQLASAGVPDGLQACIDEAEAEVSFYIGAATVAAALSDGWVKTIALLIAYTRAGSGVPPKLEEAAKTARAALADVRDGKFGSAAPATGVGAAVTESCEAYGSMR